MTPAMIIGYFVIILAAGLGFALMLIAMGIVVCVLWYIVNEGGNRMIADIAIATRASQNIRGGLTAFFRGLRQ